MTTKLELTQLLAVRNAELVTARERISILEGKLALRPRVVSVSTPTPTSRTYSDGLGRVWCKTRLPGQRVATIHRVS